VSGRGGRGSDRIRGGEAAQDRAVAGVGVDLELRGILRVGDPVGAGAGAQHVDQARQGLVARDRRDGHVELVVEPRLRLEVSGRLDLVEHTVQRRHRVLVDAGCGERGGMRFEHAAQLGQLQHSGHRQQSDGE